MKNRKDIEAIWLEPLQGYDPWKDSDDFIFEQKTAERVCKYFEDNFTHKAGEFHKKKFKLEKWEKQFIGHLFGWKRISDCTRRYREALLLIPKKNGKTHLASGIALILMGADNEPGAEVYCASGDVDQADTLFQASVFSVEQNPKFKKAFKIKHGYKKIAYPGRFSFFKILSSNAETKHGPNVHGLILDEIHIMKKWELIETLKRGTISRRQPLTIYLTTTDYSRPSPCNEIAEYARKIRDGIILNPYYLPVIYEADEEKDNWKDENVWKRVNPNYGISVKRDYFVAAIAEAEANPSLENSFKRLHLNMQTKQEKKWMDLKLWDASGSKIDSKDLLGKRCYGGLDVSSSRDISAFVLFFPDCFACLCWFWVPFDTAHGKNGKGGRVEYEKWAKNGYIWITKGATIDRDEIRLRIAGDPKAEKPIRGIRDDYDIVEIAYDPWNASELVNKMKTDDGLNMVEFRQGYKSMNEPTKKLEEDVIAHRIIHFGNPVLRWMVSNANTMEDPAGNIKLAKPQKDSQQKIDGVIALVEAYGRALIASPSEKSVYETSPDKMDKILKEIYGK